MTSYDWRCPSALQRGHAGSIVSANCAFSRDDALAAKTLACTRGHAHEAHRHANHTSFSLTGRLAIDLPVSCRLRCLIDTSGSGAVAVLLRM